MECNEVQGVRYLNIAEIIKRIRILWDFVFFIELTLSR